LFKVLNQTFSTKFKLKMNYPKVALATVFLLLNYFSVYSQVIDSLKTSIFPNTGPTPTDTTGFSFTDSYVPSNSYWASPFTEDYVYHARLKYQHATNSNKSYELRLGKGGQIYSFVTSSGETVPPQYPAKAPWVDEVWQMVAVDGTLNNPTASKSYFIHQAGVYLKTGGQTLPFYSPIVAKYYNSSDNSYTVVNWGLQAHTSDNLISGYTSSMLYYTRYKNLGNGIIQVDLLMYNFGNDNMNFINIPWGGVRRSTYDHWFSSNTDHTYQEQTGTFGSYLKSFNLTGGWAAFSSDALGNAPSLALLMDNNEGTLRMGDAGTISSRDYTVFEGIKFPGTNLGPGKAVRARNFYILDSDMDDIKNTIITQNLENETFYGSHNKTENQVDSTAYAFEYQGNELVVTEVPYANGFQLKLRPYQNSKPVFVIKSTTDEYRITTDLYTYSPYPYDGKLEKVDLLGFADKATKVEVHHAIICSGENYTFPDGVTTSNITSTIYHLSDAGTAYNGYDSLIFTTIYVTPNDVPATAFVNDGPGGVGSTTGGTNFALWLDATKLLGNKVALPANGSSVGKWADLSGNNNHYISSGLNQPTFNNSVFNAVSFDANAANPQFLTGNLEENYPYGTLFIALNATDAGNHNPLLSNTKFSLKYEQGTNSGFLGYSTVSTAYTSTLPSVFGVNHLVSFQTNCGTNTLQIHSGSNTANLNIGSATNGIPLGKLGTATDRISGSFYEIIAFQSNINTAQKILIDNYLSAKYGNMAISHNLYDEDEAANGNFDYNVAGIGRIDANNLHDNAKGSSIEIKNPTNLNDGEFLIWGDNGQALTFTDSTDLPNYVMAKTARIWSASEVNTSLSVVDVGSVDVTFDLAGVSVKNLDHVVLLMDSDNDGSFGDENYISPTSIQKTDYEGQAFLNFNALNIEDGKKFCLGYLVPDAPGGVYANLALWLAADAGTTTNNGRLANWKDKSENKKIASGGLGPVLSTASNKLLNYNPVITFDGVNNQCVTSSIMRTATSNDLNIFIVHRLDTTWHTSTIFREGVVGGGISSHLPWSNGRVFWDAGLSSGDGRVSTPSGLLSGNDALWLLSNHNGTTDLQYIRKNGKTLISDNTAISLTGNNADFVIGSAGGGLYSKGSIAEIIAFVGNEALQDQQRAKIESYLAIKYGYTLDKSAGGTAGDYLNSNNVTLWDADNNETYHYDVIGLSRDDASHLHQKQSNTRNDSVSVYLGNLSAYNGQNSATITNNLSSLILGHNQGYLNAPPAATTTEKPSGITERFTREWKVTNTNFINDFTLKIKCSGCGTLQVNDVRLLVDDDGDFTNAQIYDSPTVTMEQSSLVISGIDISMIPMNSTKYITIGSTTSFLPVELLSFDATAMDKTVHLDWQTASEMNNDYFTVERSEKGLEWEYVSTIKGAGNSIEINTYHAIDENPYSGLSYYRLKQTDLDGQFSYAPIRAVYLETDQQTVRIYPNPSAAQITVEGHANELEGLRIFNILGQDVTSNTTISGNADKLTIDISQLPNGFYSVRTRSAVKKVIKK
jgi:hypothetical protein